MQGGRRRTVISFRAMRRSCVLTDVDRLWLLPGSASAAGGGEDTPGAAPDREFRLKRALSPAPEIERHRDPPSEPTPHPARVSWSQIDIRGLQRSVAGCRRDRDGDRPRASALAIVPSSAASASATSFTREPNFGPRTLKFGLRAPAGRSAPPTRRSRTSFTFSSSATTTEERPQMAVVVAGVVNRRPRANGWRTLNSRLRPDSPTRAPRSARAAAIAPSSAASTGVARPPMGSRTRWTESGEPVGRLRGCATVPRR